MAQEFRIKVVVDPRDAAKGSRAVKKELADVKKQAGGVGKALRSAFLFLGGASAITGGIRLLAGFSQEMSTVAAITQATTEEFAALTEEAKRLGTETRFSASQAAEGLVSLARAGFDANEALSSIEGTLKLAQAGALDLGVAADIATNVLTGFGLEVDQTARVVDVLALGANSANTDVRGFGEAMKFIAPVAAGLKVPLEEAAAAVGALANAGLKGGLGGRGLRGLLAELQSPAENLASFFREAGFAADQYQISSVGLSGALDALSAVGVDATNVFGLLENSAATAFLALQSQRELLPEFTRELELAAGSADRIARIMDDNLNGAILATKSALQGLILELGGAGATGAFRDFFDLLTKGLRLAGKNIDITVKSLEGLVFVIGVSLARKAIPAAIGALNSLKVALLTHPFTALAGVISIALGALVAFRDEIVLFEEQSLTAGNFIIAAFQEIGKTILFSMDIASKAWPIFQDVATASLVALGASVEEFFNGFGLTSDSVMSSIVEVFRVGFNRMIGFGSGMVLVMGELFGRMKDVAIVVFEILSRGTKVFWTFWGGAATGAISNVSEQLGKFAGDSQEKIEGTLEDLKLISDELQKIKLPPIEDSSLDQLKVKLLQLLNPMDIVEDSVETFSKQFEKDFIGEFADNAKGGFDALKGEFDRLKEVAEQSLIDLGFDPKEIAKRFKFLFEEIKHQALINQFGPFIPDAPDPEEAEQFGPTKKPRADFAIPEPDPEPVQERDLDGISADLSNFLGLLEQEKELLKLGSDERRIANELIGIEEQLKRALTDSERELVEQSLREIQALEDQAILLDQIRGPQEEYARAIAALDALLEAGVIQIEEYNRAVKGLAVPQEAELEGFAKGLAKIVSEGEQIDLAFATVGAAFNGALNALQEFVATGKVDFRSLIASILSDLARLAAQKAFASLLGSLGGAPGDGIAGTRAEGGPVLAGSTYLVGEEGTELFRPTGSGNIVPAGETAALLGNGDGRGQTSTIVNVQPTPVQVNNYLVQDPNEIPTAMDTPAGDRVITNSLSRNKSQNKSILS